MSEFDIQWRLRQIAAYPKSFQRIALSSHTNNPIIQGFMRQSLSDEDVSKEVHNGRNIGLRIPKGVVVLDVDPRNFEEGKNPLKDLIGLYPHIGNAPRVRSGGGGYHIFMGLMDGVHLAGHHPKHKGIEFKCYGRFITSAGSTHKTTRNMYEWDITPTTGFLPEFPQTLQIHLEKTFIERRDVERIDLDENQLSLILAGMNPSRYSKGNYNAWFALMASVHYATYGAEWARDLFFEWASGDPAYPSLHHLETNIRTWDTLAIEVSSPISTATLLYFAKKEGVSLPDGLSKDVEQGYTAELSQMNERHAVVMRGEKAMILEEEQTNKGLVVKFYDPNSFHQYRSNETIPVAAKIDKNGEVEKFIMSKLTKAWMDWAGRRSYKKLVFIPSYTGQRQAVPKGAYNTWLGWSTPKMYASTYYIDTLIDDVLCSGVPEQSEYLRNWLAFVIQKPHLLPQVAVVLQGPKGMGKGLLANLMKDITHPYSGMYSNLDYVFGTFNGVLAEKIFIVLDEFVWSKSDSKRESLLKNVITEPDIGVQRKFAETETVNNYVHMLITSNEDQVVPVSVDERRYFLLRVKGDYWADANARREWFAKCLEERDGGGREAFFTKLTERDITNFMPTDVPHTQAMKDHKYESTGYVADWWEGVLHGEGGKLDFSKPVKSDDLFNQYIEDIRSMNANITNETQKSFLSRLSNLLPHGGEGIKKRLVIDGKKVRVWDFPPKQDCLAYLKNVLK